MLYTEEEFTNIFHEILDLAYINFVDVSDKKDINIWKNETKEIYNQYLTNKEKCFSFVRDHLPLITGDLDYRLLDYQSISKESHNVKKEIYNIVFNGSQLECQLKTFEELRDFLVYRNKFSKNREDVKEDVKIRMIEIFGEEALQELGFNVNRDLVLW